MKKIYFGVWQNFYLLSWPIRFFVEAILFLFVVFLLYKLLKKLVRTLRMKPYIVKGSVWAATEVVYLLGKDRQWAVETDNKIVEWGEKKLNGTADGKTTKRHTALKYGIILGIIILYIAAVFVDLPLSRYLQEDYLAEFANIKASFQKYEEAMSRGYEDYPPLFVKREPEEVEEPVEATVEKEKIPVYIQLNEKGKPGANIRQEPSLDAEVVGGVNGGSEILYRYQWECDEEERYWIKVYIPSGEMEGWLSGKLVDDTQLETLINEPEP